MKKKELIFMLFLMALLLSGCSRKKSEYDLKAVFAYDDIQESKTEEEIIEPETKDTNDESAKKKTDISVKESEKAHSPKEQPQKHIETEEAEQKDEFDVKQESIVEITLPPTPSEVPVHYAEAPQAGTIGDDITEENPGEEGTDDGTGEGTPDEQGDGSGIGEGDDDGKGTGDEADTGEDGNMASPGDANLDIPVLDEPEPEPEQPPSEEPEEPVSKGLEYEGTLGRYIWGEAPDVSNLHVYYVEGEERREVTDYSISMDYPELKNPGEIHSAQISAELYSPIYTYAPGIYNATIVYEDTFCEVPYELDIVFVCVNVEISNYCTNPEVHGTEVEYDERGDVIEVIGEKCLNGEKYNWCRHCSSTYSYIYKTIYSENGQVKYYIKRYCDGRGGYFLLFPIYYDYNFTREDYDACGIKNDYIYSETFYYDTMEIDKDALYQRSEYVYEVWNSYAHIDILVPEEITIEWLHYDH